MTAQANVQSAVTTVQQYYSERLGSLSIIRNIAIIIAVIIVVSGRGEDMAPELWLPVHL